MRVISLSLLFLAIGWLADGFRVAKKRGEMDVQDFAKNSCGKKGASAEIVNGDDASPCEFPWQVALMYGKRSFCGGTLISSQWVLTAAHCAPESGDYVMLGMHNISRSSESSRQNNSISKWIPHPRYNDRTTSHDYALIRLGKTASLNKCVAPACLPSRDVAAGTKCWATGWGALKEGGSSPKILQKGLVTTISTSNCVKNYNYSSSDIDNSMLCAQGGSKSRVVDACQGDSGGPLVCEAGGSFTVFGATSWGIGCAEAIHPGVWARVYEVREWIRSETGL